MSLIETFSGNHLLSVEIQPDETYFCKTLDADEVGRLDEAAGAFRKGDHGLLSDLLSEEIDFLDWYKVDSEENDIDYDERIELIEAKIDCLKRLQKAATAMEANHDN